MKEQEVCSVLGVDLFDRYLRILFNFIEKVIRCI